MAVTSAQSPRGRKRVLGTLIIDEDDRVFVKSPRVGLHEAPATTAETVRLLQTASTAAPVVPAAAAAASTAAAAPTAAAAVTTPATTPAADAAPSTPPFALDRLPDELLARVLACMPTPDLVSCAQGNASSVVSAHDLPVLTPRHVCLLPSGRSGLLITIPFPFTYVCKLVVCARMRCSLHVRSVNDSFPFAVCRNWGQLAEQEFRTTCRRQNWILPRRPRGIYATTPWPWRFLWLEHVCKACRKPGTFPISAGARMGERQVALACKDCILNSTHLRTQLEANSLTVATVSNLGKHLLPKSERWAR
eukprot:m.232997 g.232997  ORF g.232997 m.232997 type:complete len:306 (+) comp18892_c1_seq1:531-1448(+)